MRTLHAVALAALIAAAMLLFLVVTRHHYAWFYPRWSDQVQYLGQSYTTYDLARTEGYGAAAWAGVTQVCAQGCLHEVLTLPIFAAFGASRTAALAVNFLAFAALLVATFLAIRRISASYSMAWASAGLLLALQFPWSGIAGSAVDFRLDWMTACAYGVALATAIAGRGFRSTSWAVLLGGAVGATVLLRFLTVVYFGLIFLALLIWLLLQRDRWGRCCRLALAGIVALAVFGPALWHDRAAIYYYYWVDHFVGAGRALHDSHLGVIDSVRWVITQAIYYKVGLKTLGLGLLAALIVAYRAGSPSRKDVHGAAGIPTDGAWVATLAFICAPAAVLAYHPIKDQPPACVLIPGTVWIVLLVWMHLVKRSARGFPAGVGACVLAGGLFFFVRAEAATSTIDREAPRYRAINGLGDFLFFRSETDGLSRSRVGVTWLLSGVYADSLRILAYERHHRMLDFAATLPSGLSAPTSEVAMKSLSDSDLVCLVTRANVGWPFDSKMQEMLPAMREWCEGHMTYVGRVDTEPYSMSVYERREYKAMPAAKGADLDSLVGAAASGPPYAEALIPAAPIFVSQAVSVASAGRDFRFLVRAAISPVHYQCATLPEGLAMNPKTGEISGRFPHAGDFSAEVHAINPVGNTTGQLEFHVEDGPWFAFLSAPPACATGVPFDVKFGAFDAAGTLDFIDVTDLTARRTIERLEATDEQRQSWAGIHRMVLSQPGPHIILMRFARYDPAAKVPYTFVDHQCVVDVTK